MNNTFVSLITRALSPATASKETTAKKAQNRLTILRARMIGSQVYTALFSTSAMSTLAIMAARTDNKCRLLMQLWLNNKWLESKYLHIMRRAESTAEHGLPKIPKPTKPCAIQSMDRPKSAALRRKHYTKGSSAKRYVKPVLQTQAAQSWTGLASNPASISNGDKATVTAFNPMTTKRSASQFVTVMKMLLSQT